MDHGSLPDGVELQRTTDEWGADSVPAGLLRAHRIAEGVWGRVRVSAGQVEFVWESDCGPPVTLGPGDSLVIPPMTAHHVEPDADARFLVEFHR